MGHVGVSSMLFNRFVITLCTSSGSVHSCSYPKFFTMPKEREIQIGIDQSTSETGVYVKSYPDNEFICIMSIKNEGLSPDDYTFMFEKTLSSMFSESKVRRLVYESHKGIGDNKYVSNVLRRLATSIKNLKATCPGLKDAEMATERPNAWRSSFIPKETYAGNYNTENVKYAVLAECLKRYPQLLEFSKVCSKSYDAFEAIGILDGHLEKNYTKDGVRIVTKSLEIERTHQCAKHYEVYSDLEDIKSIIAKYNDIIKIRGIVNVYFNPDLTVDENARRMTSNTNEVVMMSIPKGAINALITWETGVRLKEGQSFALVCYRASKKQGAVLHGRR